MSLCHLRCLMNSDSSSLIAGCSVSAALYIALSTRHPARSPRSSFVKSSLMERLRNGVEPRYSVRQRIGHDYSSRHIVTKQRLSRRSVADVERRILSSHAGRKRCGHRLPDVRPSPNGLRDRRVGNHSDDDLRRLSLLHAFRAERDHGERTRSPWRAPH
jgi:hypothetical protein